MTKLVSIYQEATIHYDGVIHDLNPSQ